MSARDSVRRLLESATTNARAVISAMKTFDATMSELGEKEGEEGSKAYFRKPCRIGLGL